MDFSNYQQRALHTEIYNSDMAIRYIVYEFGDVLKYIAALAAELDINLDDVAHVDLAKLAARAEAGTIGGSGDDR